MSLPDESRSNRSSATLGLAGGKLCFVRDSAAEAAMVVAAPESFTTPGAALPEAAARTTRGMTGGANGDVGVGIGIGSSAVGEAGSVAPPRPNIKQSIGTLRKADVGAGARKRRAKLQLPSPKVSEFLKVPIAKREQRLALGNAGPEEVNGSTEGKEEECLLVSEDHCGGGVAVRRSRDRCQAAIRRRGVAVIVPPADVAEAEDRIEERLPDDRNHDGVSVLPLAAELLARPCPEGEGRVPSPSEANVPSMAATKGGSSSSVKIFEESSGASTADKGGNGGITSRRRRGEFTMSSHATSVKAAGKETNGRNQSGPAEVRSAGAAEMASTPQRGVEYSSVHEAQETAGATKEAAAVFVSSSSVSPIVGSRVSKRLAASAKAKALAEAERAAEAFAAEEVKTSALVKKQRHSPGRLKGTIAPAAAVALTTKEDPAEAELVTEKTAASERTSGKPVSRKTPPAAEAQQKRRTGKASSTAGSGGSDGGPTAAASQPASVASIFLPRGNRKERREAKGPARAESAPPASALNPAPPGGDAAPAKLAPLFLQQSGSIAPPSRRGSKRATASNSVELRAEPVGALKGKGGKGREILPVNSSESKGATDSRDGSSYCMFLASGVPGGKVDRPTLTEDRSGNVVTPELEVMEIEDDDVVAAIEIRPGLPRTDETATAEVTVVEGAAEHGGQALAAREMTDDQLLSAVDMFLTKQQRRRKRLLVDEQLRKRKDIDTARKILSDRAQRDAWAHAAGGVLVRGGVGNGSTKRLRSVASIFSKPFAEPAPSSKEERGVSWKAMPAPFPVSVHVLAAADASRNEQEDGGSDRGGEGHCHVCADEARRVPLHGEVVPGGLPPLPVQGGAGGKKFLAAGSVNKDGRCEAEASASEALAWRNAARRGAASRQGERRSELSFVDDGSDAREGRSPAAAAAAAEGGCGRLQSPAALLFADPVEECARKRSGEQSGGAVLERSSLSESGAVEVSSGRRMEQAGGDKYVYSDSGGFVWGETIAVPRAKREKMEKIALERRSGAATADALWTELYRPTSPDEVCGNAYVVAALSRWLSEWKERRGQRGGEEARASGSDRNFVDDSEYDWVRFSDDDEPESRLCNMAMLCGLPGVGKTSAVYGCATALGYEVIEVNSSQVRSGAAIRRLFGEATQSHHVSTAESNCKPRAEPDSVAAGRGLSGIFPPGRGGHVGSTRGRGRSKGGGRGAGGDNPGRGKERGRPLGNEKDEVTKAASPKLTLILFEEVDLVFEDDVGFLGALRDLRRGAKCPVILTAECFRQDFAQLSCDILYLPRPRLVELEACLMAVAAAEGLDVSPSGLRALAQFHLGDLRACLLTLQACKGRGRSRNDPCPTSSVRTSSGGGRRSRRAIKGAPSENVASQSEERSSPECWRRLVNHVEAEYAVAHYLAFDTFLPALAETLAREVSAADTDAAGKRAPASGTDKWLGEGYSSNAGKRLVEGLVPEERKELAGVGSLSPRRVSELPPEAFWEPPFFRRWPEVWSIFPHSAPAETCPLSTAKCAALFGAGGVKKNVSGAENGGEKDEDSLPKFTGRGHRVVITGRHFAHPAAWVGDRHAPEGKVKHALSADDGDDSNGTNASVFGNPKLQDPPRQAGSSWSDASLVSAAEIKSKQAVAPKAATAADDFSLQLREVFVRFGEVEVPGKVISDTLVEAFAPPNARSGFVNVVVVVRGRGPGGDLASDASASETGSSKRYSVLFRYCAPPPPFPPIIGVKHGMTGGPRGKRRKSLPTDNGKENIPRTGGGGAENRSEASPSLAINGRYGPILLDDGEQEDDVFRDDDELVKQLGCLPVDDREDDEPLVPVKSRTSAAKKRRWTIDNDDDEEEEEKKREGNFEGRCEAPEPGSVALTIEKHETFRQEGFEAARGTACETDCGGFDGGSPRARVIATPVEDGVDLDSVDYDKGSDDDVDRKIDGSGASRTSSTAACSGRVAALNVEKRSQEGRSFEECSVEASCKTGVGENGLDCGAAGFEGIANGERDEPRGGVRGDFEDYSSGPGEETTTADDESDGVMASSGIFVFPAGRVVAPYDLPTPAEAEWQRGLGALLKATCALADTFSAADVIGGVSLGRGLSGAGPPAADGGDDFVMVAGPPWPVRDPRVAHGFMEDEAVAGPCANAEGLPRTLWDGARDWYHRSICRRERGETSRYFLSPRMLAPNESPEDLVSVDERRERDGPGGGGGGSVQATALRGHCLAYCQRDRADFVCSGNALATRPLRARGSSVLPNALTLDLAPALTRLCAIEEERQAGNALDVGGRRGGRFRHYLVRTGVVRNYHEAERIGRMYKEPAW